MLSRRLFLGASAATLTSLSTIGCASGTASKESATASVQPTEGVTPMARTFDAEWEAHQRTFMSWPTAAIWKDDVDYVRDDIANLARAIADFEEVVMLASPEDEDEAQYQCGQNVTVQTMPVNDLWARDTVPVFVQQDQGVTGIDFNFNGWGNKQLHDRDGKVAQALLTELNVPHTETWLVAEGGSLETDGDGTLLVTESSLVNENRNPGRSRDEIEAELKRVLGVGKVIWFKGVYGEDITDAHIDSLVRYVAPGVVLLDRPGPNTEPDVWSESSDQARSVLENSTDAKGRPFTIVDLPQPDPNKIRDTEDDFLSSYVNFYVANGAVFVAEFGDKNADKQAQRILGEQFTDRKIVPVRIDTIASGGGGIHCATHDMPTLRQT